MSCGTNFPGKAVHQVQADKFRVRRRNGLTGFLNRHPVAAHCFGIDPLGLLATVIEREVAANVLASLHKKQRKAHRFKNAMTADAKPEHAATQHHGRMQRRTGHVLDNPRTANGDECLPDWINKVWVIFLTATPRSRLGITLAWGRGVKCSKSPVIIAEIVEGIGLNEFEWVSRLRLDVHADNIEAGAMIADCTAASAAKEVQQTWTGFLTLLRAAQLGLRPLVP